MGYVSWSVVFGEQPSAAKWNILGTNDSSFNDGTGIGAVIGSAHFLAGVPVQIVETPYTAVATTSTQIPTDDTIPQISEGSEFMTQAITPKSATNKLSIEAILQIGTDTAGRHIVSALFQDATTNALAANSVFIVNANVFGQTILRHTMVAGTTSSTTFRIRAGISGSGTLSFNGLAGARFYGGITLSSIKITEYKV